MVYNVDELSDVKQHDAFHNRFTNKLAFRVTTGQLTAWKENLYFERVDKPIAGILFRFDKFITATIRRKTEEIVKVCFPFKYKIFIYTSYTFKTAVNEELGFCSELPIWNENGLRQVRLGLLIKVSYFYYLGFGLRSRSYLICNEGAILYRRDSSA